MARLGVSMGVLVVAGLLASWGCVTSDDPPPTTLADQWSEDMRGRYILGTELRLRALDERGLVPLSGVELVQDEELVSFERSHREFRAFTTIEGATWLRVVRDGRTLTTRYLEIARPTELWVALGANGADLPDRFSRLADRSTVLVAKYMRPPSRYLGEGALTFSADGVSAFASVEADDTIVVDERAAGLGMLHFEAAGLRRDVEVVTVERLDRLELEEWDLGTGAYLVVATEVVDVAPLVEDAPLTWTLDGEVVPGTSVGFWCEGESGGGSELTVRGGGLERRLVIPFTCTGDVRAE